MGNKPIIKEDLINKAIQVIKDNNSASATLLQRTLNIWFATADAIMDELEDRGLVWPLVWAKKREIFIK